MRSHTIPPEAVYWCRGATWQPSEPVLLLRTCAKDGGAHNEFLWPLEVGALVEAPDWDPADRCGGGLHGLLWGEGNANLVSSASDAIALVIEACASETVEITRDGGGKAKCRRARVRFVGDLREAGAWLSARAPAGKRCNWGTATAGDWGTATAGDGGTATAGDWGTVAIAYWDDARQRYRSLFGEVGEGELLPGVPYRVDTSSGTAKFVRAESEVSDG